MTTAIRCIDERYIHPISLHGGPTETAVALSVAAITINWGRLEYWLYCILEAVDPKRATVWTSTFFGSGNWQTKKRAVEKEVLKEITSYPEFHGHLRQAFTDLDALRISRNKLAHGLWRELSTGVFEIMPLRFDKKQGRLDGPIRVDRTELNKILGSMNSLEQRLAALGTEVIAHQWLKKYRQRKQRAIPTAP